MRDGINKAGKLIVDHCLKHGIGNLVIGWNQGFKYNADMGQNEQSKVCSNASRKIERAIKATLRFTRY